MFAALLIWEWGMLTAVHQAVEHCLQSSAQHLLLRAGEALMTQEIIEHVASLVEQKGSDVWWQAGVQDLLPESLRKQADQLQKGVDTMDV